MGSTREKPQPWQAAGSVDAPYEVHFEMDGETFVDAYPTAADQSARMHELLVDEKLHPGCVRLFHVQRTPLRKPMIDIVTAVASRHGLSVRSLKEKKKAKLPHLVRARDEAYYWLSTENYTDRETAIYFKRSRETVSIGVTRHMVRTGAPVQEVRLARLASAANLTRHPREHHAMQALQWTQPGYVAPIAKGPPAPRYGPPKPRPVQMWWGQERREARLTQMWNDDVPTVEIAEAMGTRLDGEPCTVAMVGAKASRMKLRARPAVPKALMPAEERALRPRQRWWKSEGRIEKLKLLWFAETPVEEIAAALGEGGTIKSVRMKAKNLGLPRRPLGLVPIDLPKAA